LLTFFIVLNEFCFDFWGGFFRSFNFETNKNEDKNDDDIEGSLHGYRVICKLKNIIVRSGGKQLYGNQ